MQPTERRRRPSRSSRRASWTHSSRPRRHRYEYPKYLRIGSYDNDVYEDNSYHSWSLQGDYLVVTFDDDSWITYMKDELVRVEFVSDQSVFLLVSKVTLDVYQAAERSARKKKRADAKAARHKARDDARKKADDGWAWCTVL